MRKLSVILFILLFSISAFSQSVKFGIKAGAESSTTPKYIPVGGTSNWHIEAIKNASWGFHGGVFTRVNIFSFYVQPEVVFVSTSFDYEVGPASLISSSARETKSQIFNRLSVPVLFGVKFGPMRLNAGPAVDIQLGTPKDLIADPNFSDMYKSAIWGYQAGFGFDILRKLTFDARYADSLGGKFGDAVTIGNQSFKLDQSQKSFLLSIGIMF